MFDALEGTVDQALEREREALRCETRALCAERARLDQRLTEIVRIVEDRGDWQAAGCSSSADWLAQVCTSDYRAAQRITRTSAALRLLPALDHALSTGALNLDQVVAAAEVATPGTDAELARVAVGKGPSEIALLARTMVPPVLADDRALYARRALRMAWRGGGRELVFSGSLPLEHGAIFEQAIRGIAKAQRAVDKKAGTMLEWQQSTADALVTLAQDGGASDGGIRRNPTTLIVHISEDAPPTLEGAGPISIETAERLTCGARRLVIQPHGRDLRHSRITRCASYPQLRALYKRASGHCQYPGCTATRELIGHHMLDEALGGIAELANMILLCSRHHTILHDHHLCASGSPERPDFTDADGRAITTNQPHAPPR